MPLETETKPIYREFLNMVDPRRVVELVSACDLHGLGGHLWSHFRYPAVRPPTPAEQRQALLTTLPREGRACLIFDVCCQILRNLRFRYDYVAASPLLMEGNDCSPGVEQNCNAVTHNLAGLLYAFGFPAERLHFQKSNPRDLAGCKLVRRAAADVDPANVQGRAGAAVQAGYTPAMCPLDEELSNGFKPKFKPNGVATLEMCDRDPFLNHFCCVVVGEGFRFPFLDPLTGARYRTGQADFFAGYNWCPGGDLRYGAGDNARLFVGQDNPTRSALYQIPRAADHWDVPKFLPARSKFAEQGLWVIADPADWQLRPPFQISRHRAVAAAARQSAARPTTRPRATEHVPWQGLNQDVRNQVQGLAASAVGLPSPFDHPPVIRQLFAR